jgi:hypothetical protein
MYDEKKLIEKRTKGDQDFITKQALKILREQREKSQEKEGRRN